MKRACYEIKGLNPKEGRCQKCSAYPDDVHRCWLIASHYCETGFKECMTCKVFIENNLSKEGGG